MSLLMKKETNMDDGLLCNLTWALRHLITDQSCAVCSDMAQSIKQLIDNLLTHADARIRANAQAMQHAMEERKKRSGLTIRRDRSMLAVHALTELGSCSAPTETCSSEPEFQAAESPVKRRPSLLSPWKKAMGAVPAIKHKRVRMTKSNNQDFAKLLSVAITQVADG